MPRIYFEWDPLDDVIVAERDENGNVIAEYTHMGGYHGEVLSMHRNGESRYFHYDADGNVIALTDDDENVTDTYGYTAFGERTEHTGATINPFQFQGGRGLYTDSATGTVFSQRGGNYDPQHGRWLTPQSPGINSYAVNAANLQANRSADLYFPLVEIVKVSKEGCLDVHFQVRFTVPPPLRDALENWVVQEVKTATEVYDCATGHDITHRFGIRPDHFWEAFDMNPVVRQLDPLKPFEDDYELQGRFKDTRGVHYVTGVAKGAANVPLPPTFVPKTVPNTGDLPTTRTQPPGWDRMDGATHNMNITWDCCCDKECVVVQTTPKWSIDVPKAGCPEQVRIFETPPEKRP